MAILLVEDDKDLNQIVCRHLNTFGYQIGIDNYMVKPIDPLCGIHSFVLFLQNEQKDASIVYSVVSQLLLISTTAREIAGGNFSVRIPPQRCDGKKMSLMLSMTI